nr:MULTISPECIES: LacI family DNA-binding transcriptional regulator [unclassified Collinsella]
MLENAHLSEGVAVAKQRVTIADVAREAGTSTASVSYYLNDKREKLSEKTQAKIARVIKELGYVPNAQAQTLTGKQTHVIAIIILDNTNKWAGLVLNGMEQVMLPAGYQTVVCTSNFDPETELIYVDKMLSLGVDGFIIQPTANFKAVHDRIKRAGKPVVFFDAAIYSPGTSWIKTNLYDGVYNATQALLDAGYEDFFSIAANMTEMRTRMERFQGYAEALAANGQLYKAIPIDHNKPSISELTEYLNTSSTPPSEPLSSCKISGHSPVSTRPSSPWPIYFRSKSAFWDSTAKTGPTSPRRPSPRSSSPSTRKVAKQPRCCSPYLMAAANPVSSAFSNANSIGSVPPRSRPYVKYEANEPVAFVPNLKYLFDRTASAGSC